MQRTLPIVLALAGVASLQTASAQSVNEIISKVTAAANGARDISFKLQGSATLDSGGQKLDLDIQSIPAQSLARVLFNAPDALADNIVVVDKKTVYNYLSLTNQVTVQDASRQANQAGFGVDFSQFTNAANLLTSRYDVKLIDTTGAAGARLYQLEATPKNSSLSDRNRVWISEQGWRPTRVQVLGAGGKVTADLNIVNYKLNAGLNPARLRALPKDAEIVRR